MKRVLIILLVLFMFTGCGEKTQEPIYDETYVRVNSYLVSKLEIEKIRVTEKEDEYVFNVNVKGDKGFTVHVGSPDGYTSEFLDVTTGKDKYDFSISKEVLDKISVLILSFYKHDGDGIDIVFDIDVLIGRKDVVNNDAKPVEEYVIDDTCIDILDRIYIDDRQFDGEYELKEFYLKENDENYEFLFKIDINGNVSDATLFDPPDGDKIHLQFDYKKDGTYDIKISKQVFDSIDEAIINFNNYDLDISLMIHLWRYKIFK